MPQYNFRPQNGRPLEPLLGVELPDDRAAQHAALRHLCDLVENHPGMLEDIGDLRMVVTLEDGLALFTIELSVALSAAASSRWRHHAPASTKD